MDNLDRRLDALDDMLTKRLGAIDRRIADRLGETPQPGATADAKAPTPGPEAKQAHQTLQNGITYRSALKQTSWTPAIGMDRHIFPSFVLATPNLRLPDQQYQQIQKSRLVGKRLCDFIGVRFPLTWVGRRVRVQVQTHGPLIGPSVFDEALVAKGGDCFAFPHLQYDYRDLRQIRNPEPVDVSFEVTALGGQTEKAVETLTVHSVTDCPFWVRSDDSEPGELDLSWVFSTYVNENHPWVDGVLKSALEAKLVPAFIGYQGDRQDVFNQVLAVWNVLQRRQIRYGNSTTPSAHSGKVISQNVRLFDESIRAKQANCVDGSVLIAAVLYRIGILPQLVLIPGHMFLAFRLSEDPQVPPLGLETTMLGNADLATYDDAPDLPDSIRERAKNDASVKTFVSALKTGTEALGIAMSRARTANPEHGIIDIQNARSLGLNALGTTGRTDESQSARQRPLAGSPAAPLQPEHRNMSDTTKGTTRC
jgi:hypothetical protein